jgi:hypothetical protein
MHRLSSWSVVTGPIDLLPTGGRLVFGCPAARSFVVIWLPDTEIDRFIGLLAGGPIDR